jgi:cellulose synthase/poly-beta-1,6-N-acetylglucosamine synthase-like glycosyltransferase
MRWASIWSLAVAFDILLGSWAAVLYTWILYPLLLRLLNLLAARVVHPANSEKIPSVSIIIAAHNEQKTIAKKLQNCLDLVYPRDQMEIIVASDGSTDRTAEIVRMFSARDARISWLESDRRVGKSGAQNLAATRARGDSLLFTDASADMPPQALQTMIDDLADSRVGLVTATVFFGEPEDAVEKGQGFYWRYELGLRAAESDLGILATGSGQALLVRRELFRPLPACYGDDCIMPLDVRLQGYRVVQDRRAIVYDTMPHSIEGELRARIRMTARNWTGTLSRPALLNPLHFPMTSIGLVSHKLLRWLTPFFLAAVLLSSTVIAVKGGSSAFLWLQVGFYLSALIGWRLARKQKPASVFGYSFSFCLANIGFLLGIVKVLRNQKIVAY